IPTDSGCLSAVGLSSDLRALKANGGALRQKLKVLCSEMRGHKSQIARVAPAAAATWAGREATANTELLQLQNQYLRPRRPVFCVFCRKNGEPEAFSSGHTLKDGNGSVVCPVLSRFTCPLCGATGDSAHTVKYCPLGTGHGCGRRKLTGQCLKLLQIGLHRFGWSALLTAAHSWVTAFANSSPGNKRAAREIPPDFEMPCREAAGKAWAASISCGELALILQVILEVQVIEIEAQVIQIEAQVIQIEVQCLISTTRTGLLRTLGELSQPEHPRCLKLLQIGLHRFGWSALLTAAHSWVTARPAVPAESFAMESAAGLRFVQPVPVGPASQLLGAVGELAPVGERAAAAELRECGVDADVRAETAALEAEPIQGLPAPVDGVLGEVD
uniref:Nanos-type domain-containing protein n=1 Tax=Macrostomum lignano TaxID=282301 RepID=A0A1I8F3U0_9PLAT